MLFHDFFYQYDKHKQQRNLYRRRLSKEICKRITLKSYNINKKN